MRDEIVRAITGDGLVKAVAVTGRDVVERARNIHKLLPMSTAALGRALLGASMMGDMLKEEQGSLTLQIKGGGPLGTILAVSDYEGNVRGYVQHPQVDLMEKYRGKLDVGAAVGTDGTLTVIKDIGLKEPYVGSIGLFSGEIADDLAMYFVESEQIPTACALGVLVGLDQSVTAAGGYLIQLLPGADEEMISKIEAGVHAMGSVSHALADGLDGEGLLKAVLKDFELEILEKHPVEYRCYCSRDRVTRALISMGRQELSGLIAEQGQAELSCQFCDKVYRYSREELEDILANMVSIRAGPGGSALIFSFRKQLVRLQDSVLILEDAGRISFPASLFSAGQLAVPGHRALAPGPPHHRGRRCLVVLGPQLQGQSSYRRPVDKDALGTGIHLPGQQQGPGLPGGDIPQLVAANPGLPGCRRRRVTPSPHSTPPAVGLSLPLAAPFLAPGWSPEAHRPASDKAGRNLAPTCSTVDPCRPRWVPRWWMSYLWDLDPA